MIIGKKQIKRKFLFLPLTIEKETKWLTIAKIEYLLSEDIQLVENQKKVKTKWIPLRFI